MAELVEYRIEKTIGELEQLERYGLLSGDEIKTIVRKRKAFEYRLVRSRKFKEDYLKYIAYEQSVRQLVRARRKRLGFGRRLAHIEHSIALRVQSLYRKVVFRYQFDVRLWLSYIKFCKSLNMKAKVSSLYSRALQIHGGDHSLWISAAKYNFETNSLPQTARKLMQRSIRVNPLSRELWIEYFRLELMYCDKIRKRRSVLEKELNEKDVKDEIQAVKDESIEAIRDEVWDGMIAMIVYRNAVTAIEEFEFAAQFLPICSCFDHNLTKAHKTMIRDDIRFRFADREEAWNLLARNMLFDANDEIKFNPKLTKQEKNSLKKSGLKNAIEVYEEMVEKLNTEQMWSYYIKFNLKLLSKCHKESAIRVKLKRTLDVIERAWNRERLAGRLFREWLTLLNSCADRDNHRTEIQRILIKGFERYDCDADVWRFGLSLLMEVSDSKSEVRVLFERALSRLATQSECAIDNLIEIWRIYIDWSVKSLHPREMMDIALRAARLTADQRSAKVAKHFKHHMLTVARNAFGIERARSLYESNKLCLPITLDYFATMLAIEKDNSPPNVPLIRSIYEEMVSHFGADNSELWIEFMQFEMRTNPSKLGLIYHKAIKTLNPNECDKFIADYSLLRSNNFNVNAAIDT